MDRGDSLGLAPYRTDNTRRIAEERERLAAQAPDQAKTALAWRMVGIVSILSLILISVLMDDQTITKPCSMAQRPVVSLTESGQVVPIRLPPGATRSPPHPR